MTDSYYNERLSDKLSQKLNEIISLDLNLVKTLLISSVIISIIVIILYFNYILIGMFLTTIFMGLITGLALKTTKDKIEKKLINSLLKEETFMSYSLIVNLVLFIKFIFIFVSNLANRQNTVVGLFKNYKKNSKSRKSKGSDADIELTKAEENDQWNIMDMLNIILVSYIMIFKVNFRLCMILIISVLIIDALLRLLLDASSFLIKYFNLYGLYFDNYDSKKKITLGLNINLSTHSLISSLLICYFILFFVFTFLIACYFIYIDLSYLIKVMQSSNSYNFKDYIISQIPQSIDINSLISSNIKGIKILETFLKNSNITLNTNDSNHKQGSDNTSLFSGIYNFYTPENKELIINECIVHNINDTIIYKVINILPFDYLTHVYCGLFLLVKQMNIEFSELIDKIYLIISQFIQLIAGTIFSYIFNFSIEVVNSAMLFIIFLTCCFYTLKYTHAEYDISFRVLNYLKISNSVSSKITSRFKFSLQGVFISTAQIFSYHFIITWLYYDFNEVPLAFIFSLLAGIISILPLFSSYLLLLPAIIFNLYKTYTITILNFGSLKIIMFSILYIITSNRIFSDCYQLNVQTHPYITGMSFMMGFYTFGLIGIVYGPVILCITLLIKDICNLLFKDDDTDY